MRSKKLNTAVKIILLLWLILKLADAAVMIITMGSFGLSFLVSIEFGFRSLVFVKSTSLGLAIFIGCLVITAISLPLSFLVLSDRKAQNIVGFCAYAAATLLDIVSAAILGFQDIPALAISLLISVCLIIYFRQNLINAPDSPEKAAGSIENPEKYS